MKLEEWIQISEAVGKHFCFPKNFTVTYIGYSFQYKRSDHEFYKCLHSLFSSCSSDQYLGART